MDLCSGPLSAIHPISTGTFIIIIDAQSKAQTFFVTSGIRPLALAHYEDLSCSRGETACHKLSGQSKFFETRVHNAECRLHYSYSG